MIWDLNPEKKKSIVQLDYLPVDEFIEQQKN